MNQILYFPKEVLAKLKIKSKEKGLCMSAYIRMILTERWNEEEKRGE